MFDLTVVIAFFDTILDDVNSTSKFGFTQNLK